MEPQQLTLWPDDALPGQLPLFNRTAAVGLISEEASRYCERCEAVVVRHFPGNRCFHCETILLDFSESRKIPSEFDDRHPISSIYAPAYL